MNCITRVGVVTVLGLGLFAGCSKSGSSNGAAASGGAAAGQIDVASNPIAKAASDFLDAILKGDTQRASASLTPQAMQRIVASGKQFSPPGLESATFKIGQVATNSEGRAIVQCVLTDSSEGTPHSEEMCCLLRKIDNDWLVSGIAYGTTPDKPWTLTDFESGQNVPVTGQTMSGMAGTPGNGGPQGQPGPQASAGPPPVTPPAPIGMPPIGPSNVNSPNPGAAGLGMPAIGSPVNPSQPQAPYTALEPQSPERR